MEKILLGFILFSSSTFAIDLTVTSSTKGSSVYELKAGEHKELLGKVPLSLKGFDNSTARTLVIEREGYVPFALPISQKLQDSVEVDVKLHKISEWSPEYMKKETIIHAENIVDEIMAAQYLIDQRKNGEAALKIDELKAKYPDSLAVAILYANSLLLKGRKAEAREYYEGLLERLPDDRKYLKDMVQKISVDLGSPKKRL